MALCPVCSASLEGVKTSANEMVVALCTACFNPSLIEAGSDAATVVPHQSDMRELAPEGSIGAELLKGVRERRDALPVLPELSQRILALTRDEEASVNDLAALVREDPVLAAKVLQLANSAMYGGLAEITDLTTACARLGLKKLANCVQAVANGHLYTSSRPAFHSIMQRHMQHALVTAHCAHEIAVAIAEPQPDTLFVAGLIYRIGMVPLLDAVSEVEQGPLAELREQEDLLRDALESYYPLVGLYIVQAWNLPPAFSQTVYFQNQPGNVPDDTARSRAHAVNLAASIATASGFGPWEQGTDDLLMAHESTQYLGLTDIKLASIRVDLEDRIAPLLQVAAAQG